MQGKNRRQNNVRKREDDKMQKRPNVVAKQKAKELESQVCKVLFFNLS